MLPKPLQVMREESISSIGIMFETDWARSIEIFLFSSSLPLSSVCPAISMHMLGLLSMRSCSIISSSSDSGSMVAEFFSKKS